MSGTVRTLLLRAAGWRVVLLALMRFAGFGSALAVMLLASGVLAAIAHGDDLSVVLLTWLTGAVVVGALIVWLQRWLEPVFTDEVTARVRNDLFRRLFAIGPYRAGRHTGGALQAILTDGVAGVAPFVTQYLPAVVLAWLAVPAAVVVCLVIPGLGVWPAVIAVVGMIAAWLVPKAWRSLFQSSTDQVMVGLGRGQALFVDLVQGMTTAKAFGALDRHRARVDEDAERTRVATMRTLTPAMMHGALSSLCEVGAILGVLAYAIARPGSGAFSIVVAALVVPVLFTPMRDLGQHLHANLAATGIAAQITDVFFTSDATVSRMEEPREGHALVPHAMSPERTGAEVHLDDLTFSYPGRDRPAIDHFSYTATPGHTVGIVGRSGAGKSTLAGLLLGVLQPDSGWVSIEGANVRELPPEDLYRLMSIVSQDTYLFHGTIRDNIALGRPDATGDQVRDAARVAGLTDTIEALPDGYDTMLGERGAGLSGGQRQRLALARAVLADTPVLLLDEATSSLDPATEAEVLSAFRSVSQGRTTFMITHRLGTLSMVDEVLVIDQGRLVQTGSPGELATKATGVFGELLRAHDSGHDSAGPSIPATAAARASKELHR